MSSKSNSVDINEMRDLLRDMILSDTPEGFEAFFVALFNRPFPPHARAWVRLMYEGKAVDQGVVIQAFRYSWKTTVLSNAFMAYRIGLEPQKTSLIVQVKDETAEQTARKIAEIIETNPVWKWIFPHVVPDKERGWANKGFFVKRDDMPYGEWQRQCGRDPTFVGYGYTSDSIIGKHPNGVLLVDDIHNELNTASSRQLTEVIRILTGTILPTINAKETWVVFVGTPWVRGDALHYMISTGIMKHITTPIYTVDADGVKHLTWPEEMTWEDVERLEKLSGPIEFRRMYLCDITAAEGIELKREWLHEYPAEKINPSWSIVMGVDYASVADPKDVGDRDYFALAVFSCIPGGGLVLIDGVKEHMSSAEAQLRVRTFCQIYKGVQAIGFENLGKGEEAFQSLLYSSNLPIIPTGTANKKKGYRFGQVLAPAFQSGRIKVSDAPNAFISEFIDEWISFPTGRHDDALDAVFHGCVAGASNLLEFNEPEPGTLNKAEKKNPADNPWAKFSRRR